MALKLSKNFKLQAKGIVLETALENVLNLKLDNEKQKQETIEQLTNKVALKIVYNKIDILIK